MRSSSYNPQVEKLIRLNSRLSRIGASGYLFTVLLDRAPWLLIKKNRIGANHGNQRAKMLTQTEAVILVRLLRTGRATIRLLEKIFIFSTII